MTRRSRCFALLVVALLVVALLAGCSDARLDALDQRLASLRAKPSGELPALPETPVYQPVTYDQAGSRSPFQPERPAGDDAAASGNDLKPDLSRPREALERFTLDSLTLVGTLAIDGRNSALVRDPEGKVHRVYAGMYIGTDYGRISTITDRDIYLVEIVSNGQGGWIERRRTLSLDNNAESRQRG
ncbi:MULTISPECIES: pilus assembly protein PilP [Halomonadaceae]|uniref:Type 4a pilus biogenesis lipoprotein PilP n=1 Tax=Modicisalibacter zincidurans TaxID=1178777 RepID=A0ABP9RD23_9GAMM|nr:MULTISPECIES: pilus assembly protein PilP [Halomonas]MCD6009036.1 pilus assembly protein PilP [Halomonas sp. IOP_31]